MTTSSDPLPSDLADAHALIVSLRDTLVVERGEALVRRLENEKLKFLIAKLRREQFGQSSERGKLLVEQLELAIEDLEASQAAAEAEADIAAPAAAAAARERRTSRSPRPILPENLPVERIVYPAPCACAKCGGERLRKLGETVSRTLECEPRRWKVIEHVREKMTCRDCEAVSETPAPSHPIPRGFAGPNLLAGVLVSKFMLHQPLNRQSDTFAREGIAIDTSTLADRVGACAVALAPLVEAIRRHVLSAERIHADDTTVPVLAKVKTATGRLWTYVRDDRPFGGTDPPAAAFHYSRSRSGEYPREHLATYGGIMQADAFAGYNELYQGKRKPAPIVEAACWAHGRRKLFDVAKLSKAPIASEAVRRIDEIFAIERTINGRTAAERLAVRQDQSKPLVMELEAFLREKRALLSARSETAKAISYSLNHWAAFARFLDDGRICLSNNAAERALRGIAIGRRNWTFCGSDAGGHRAAAIYTLIETAKLNDVDPQAWLADVLARLPDHPAKRIDDLLPWAWKASQRPRHSLRRPDPALRGCGPVPAALLGCLRIDLADTTRIALESMPSTNSRVPPTHFVQRSGATLSKVIGVLFDETSPTKSNDEAIPTAKSDVLAQVLAAAGVVGDSAFPVARDKGHVLLGKAQDIGGLSGRIVAVVTREDEFSTEHFAYLKRLGKQMPGAPSVYYLENVGQSGEGEYVQFPFASALMNGVPIVLDTWRVLGTIF